MYLVIYSQLNHGTVMLSGNLGNLNNTDTLFGRIERIQGCIKYVGDI